MTHLLPLTYLTYLLPLITLATAPPPPTCSLRQLYNFHSEDIWLENIAVRSTGQLLLTTISQPWLYTFDPSEQPNPAPRIRAELPDVNGCTGITETADPDVFAISCAIHGPAAFEARGNVVITLDLRDDSKQPFVTKVADIPEAKLLNGMTTTHPDGLLLMSDSSGGSIWWANLSSTEYGILVNNDPLLQPGGIVPCGVNGIRTHGNDLFFANSGMGLFGRITLDGWGNAMGEAERLGDVPGGVRAFDDFAVDGEGTKWVATHDDAVTVIKAGGERWVIRDVGNGVGLRAPTSAAMGRGSKEEERTVYVVTGGVGMLQGGVRGGQIVAIRS